MYNVRDNIQASLGHFRMEGYWFRYSSFVPRLYNWCRELGFDAGKIMRSRAFCSDDSQGYPVILLAKHFGAFRSISQEKAYRGRNLLYVAGLHVDISPAEGQLFPLTKFIPWAAYVQLSSGERYILEQEALFACLNARSAENSEQIALDAAIQMMEDAEEVHLHLPY